VIELALNAFSASLYLYLKNSLFSEKRYLFEKESTS